jgi:hypothetical protein
MVKPFNSSRITLRAFGLLLLIVGFVQIVRIPSDKAQVRSTSDNFLTQRQEMLKSYKEKTGKEPKENLAWIPGVIDKAPNLVPAFNGLVATACILGSIACLGLSCLPMQNRPQSK